MDDPSLSNDLNELLALETRGLLRSVDGTGSVAAIAERIEHMVA